MIPNETKSLILELYKSHHSAKEVADITDTHYASVSALFRGFKAAELTKYDRMNLIPLEVIENMEVLF